MFTSNRTPRAILAVVLSTGCALLPLRAQSKPANNDARIQRIEANAVDLPLGANEPPLRVGLKKLMEIYRVPGLSIAVIDNFKIVWAKGYGVIESGSQTPVTTETLFQAGSISKPVAATAAMRLVEQGKLALDEDVNLKLKTWKVPNNEFTKTEKVTLRRVMSHSAGLTVHGFPGYDVDAPVPTLPQVLNGEKPANTAPVRVDIVPGTKARYSGGGVTIEQLLMMDVTQKPFPALLRETVLDKLGMTRSSYEQPLPAAWAAKTATATYADGKPVHGRWHVYPEMAAAGLWTTPTDLAKFAIEIARSKHGNSNRILSQKSVGEMLTPVKDEIGLGFFLDKNNPGQFGHGGADEGFQALLSMNYETGQGIAIMANSDEGSTIANYVMQSIAREYGWKYKASDQGDFGTLTLLAKLKGAEAALRRYTELKKAGDSSKHPVVNEETLNALGLRLLYSGQEQDGVAVLVRAVEEYPNSSNAFDSLGEAYAKAGKKDPAIKNYEKSLELDPKNAHAVEMIKQLRSPK